MRRRFVAIIAGSAACFGMLSMAAPAAHADTVLGESVTITIPDAPPTPTTGLLRICLTVRELDNTPHCVGI